MAKVSLTNESNGSRGYGFDVTVGAGETIEVELTDDEIANIELFGLLKVSKVASKPNKEEAAKKETPAAD
jgi:hypothetical protein